MARKKIIKTLIYSLIFSILFSVFLVYLGNLKAEHLHVFWDFLIQNAGDIFWIGLCISTIILILKRIYGNFRYDLLIRQDNSLMSITEDLEYDIEEKRTLFKLSKELNMDVTSDPSMGSMPCNIYHSQYQNHHKK
jgi:hypothetical protein